jgi:hypothetical protein
MVTVTVEPETTAEEFSFCLPPETVIPLMTPTEYPSDVFVQFDVSPTKITVALVPVQTTRLVGTLDASTGWLKVIVIVSPVVIFPLVPLFAIETDVATRPSCVAAKFADEVHELADVLTIW